jgi:hypothetical protein
LQAGRGVGCVGYYPCEHDILTSFVPPRKRRLRQLSSSSSLPTWFFSNGLATTAMMPPGGVWRIDRRLIHPSDPWPATGHPEAMKMEPPQGYFHASA